MAERQASLVRTSIWLAATACLCIKQAIRNEIVGDHLTKLRGYESYKAMQELASSPGGMEKIIEFFMGLQVWGTPEQCYKRIVDIQERTGAEAFNGVFSYAGMPYDLAEVNLRLFATEVTPEPLDLS
jgi:hypothetical protein